MTTNYRLQKQLSTVLLYVMIAIVLVIIAFPVYWLISTSLKPGLESVDQPADLHPIAAGV